MNLSPLVNVLVLVIVVVLVVWVISALLGGADADAALAVLRA